MSGGGAFKAPALTHPVSTSRRGKKVDYRFYSQLEQILGQEAVSMDEYDRRDEQADQDPGLLPSLYLFIQILISCEFSSWGPC